jgi:hypothetical protein
LYQAINADSANAPKQLHLILTTEHPEWKLPERRVAKYLKRQLKERNNMNYKQIDADLDEVSLYSTVSTSTWKTSTEAAPVSDPDPDPLPVSDNSPKEIQEEKREIAKVTSIQNETAKVEPKISSKIVPAKAYEDENDKTEESPLFCEGVNCVIS